MEKKCNTCGKVKSFDNFNKNKFTKDNLSYACKVCIRHTSGRHRWKRDKVINKDGTTFTPDDYNALFTKQQGICTICGKKKDLVVDHDHETGIVRGLLCSPCNVHIVGSNTIKTAEAVLSYLKAAT